jgi:hypothetical protein
LTRIAWSHCFSYTLKEFAAVVVSVDKALAYFAAHPEMVLELLGLYCKESAFELKQVA